MIEREVAGWAAGLRWRDVPPAVQTRVEDLLLDALGSALAGRTTGLHARVQPVAGAFAGEGSPAARAFIDAYAVTSATLCDVYRPALCHVTPVVLPPLVALTAERTIASEDFMSAFAVGLEVTVRLCGALRYASLRARGWHSPGVAGPVGAAAAAARLLGLDADGAGSAMAHGAAQGSGTFAALGTEAVKFTQARAASGGLLAALMAEGGMAAAPRWLTSADGGMLTSYSDGGAAEALTDGIGESWELMRISLRRWPAASSVQSLIDVCLSSELDASQLERVEVELAPEAYLVSGERGWQDPLAAQQSARWVVSAVLHDRDWWLDQISLERLRDVRLGSFAQQRVTVASRPDLPVGGVDVQVELRAGRRLKLASENAPGDPERPLTREQIEHKLRCAADSAGIGALAEQTLGRMAGRAPGESLDRLLWLFEAEPTQALEVPIHLEAPAQAMDVPEQPVEEPTQAMGAR